MSRLLYVVNIPRFFVSHRMPLALAARKEGYEVHVATSDADEANIARIKAAGLTFHPLPLGQHSTNPLNELKTLMALVRLYRQLKPDIVHHVSIKPVLYGGLAAKLASVPLVVNAMSGLGYVFIGEGKKPRVLRTIVQPALRLALSGKHTHMIFQNDDDRQRFIDMKLISVKRSVVIRGSGVDMHVFTPQPEQPGRPLVLFAGRLMWKKGVGDFVEAAKKLHTKARFVIAGYAERTSPDHVPLEQLEAWAAEGIIEWWGKREDMPEVFAQSHIVCLPSSYGEGVPKVLIEAAACGRSIVTTDTPGCRDIGRLENALLVKPGDVDGLVNALDTLIADDSLRQRMGEAGRTLAIQEFSLKNVNAKTFEIYGLLRYIRT